ncbi:E3 ubiquitin-protein ligase [Smittium culicis]|uniref:RING-type E3 ubiquitin transferase n=1 Tax=Smittium culicis TaxID=133412 RepID=A0A1R1YMX2_9FUNG|nr:E3 ubiquitin-protein ligase [Smittium culicis]
MDRSGSSPNMPSTHNADHNSISHSDQSAQTISPSNPKPNPHFVDSPLTIPSTPQSDYAQASPSLERTPKNSASSQFTPSAPNYSQDRNLNTPLTKSTYNDQNDDLLSKPLETSSSVNYLDSLGKSPYNPHSQNIATGSSQLPGTTAENRYAKLSNTIPKPTPTSANPDTATETNSTDISTSNLPEINPIQETSSNHNTPLRPSNPSPIHQQYPTSQSSDNTPAPSNVPALETNAPTSTRQYWCHQCQRETTTMMVPSLICTVCHGDFVEEIDPENDPRNFVVAEEEPEQNDDNEEEIEEEDGHPSYHSSRSRRRYAPSGTRSFEADFRNSENSNQDLTNILRSIFSQIPPSSASAERRPEFAVPDFESTFRSNEPRSSRSRNTDSQSNSNSQSDLNLNQSSETINNPTDSPSTESQPSTTASNPPNSNSDQVPNSSSRNNTNRSYTRSFRSSNGNGFTIFHPVNFNPSAHNETSSGPRSNRAEIPVNFGALFDLFLDGGPGNAQNFFSNLFGTAGNVGDYAWGPNGLDDIITQLMEQNQGNTPHPTSEEYIAKLERIKISSDNLDPKKECGICMDEYVESDTAIVLECHHEFHEDCILKWLRVNGTCPICRILIGDKPESDNSNMEVDSSTNNSNNHENNSQNNNSRDTNPIDSDTSTQQDNSRSDHGRSATDEPANSTSEIPEPVLPGYFPRNSNN